MDQATQGITFKKVTQEDLKSDDKVADINHKWSPGLALFLFSDGSMTKNLELIFRSKAKVKLLKEIEGVDENSRIDKAYANDITTPTINRAITMSTEDGKLIMYAESIWDKEVYGNLMKDRGDAIGSNMSRQRIEYFREIMFAGTVEGDKEVNKMLETPESEALLTRGYFFWHGGKKICFIREYFSKEVNQVLSK